MQHGCLVWGIGVAGPFVVYMILCDYVINCFCDFATYPDNHVWAFTIAIHTCKGLDIPACACKQAQQESKLAAKRAGKQASKQASKRTSEQATNKQSKQSKQSKRGQQIQENKETYKSSISKGLNRVLQRKRIQIRPHMANRLWADKQMHNWKWKVATYLLRDRVYDLLLLHQA